MRWSTKEPKDKRQWHSWYAWYPVNILGTRTWVWLERVERKQYSNWWESFWRYRNVA